jgi:transcriptional regulator with XRE-family HTH domain
MINPYSLLLKQYISESKISLSELETEMRKRGFKRNKAYLSSLQNGKMPVPSFEETQALCEILGGDPTRLASTGILPLVGNLIELSEEDYFRSLASTIITMLATLVDINKEKIDKELKMYLEKNKEKFGFTQNPSSDDNEFLEFENIKLFLETTNSQTDWEGILINEIKEDFEEEVSMDTSERFMGYIKDFQNSQEENLSPDEVNYLIECLGVYRKLNLKSGEVGM